MSTPAFKPIEFEGIRKQAAITYATEADILMLEHETEGVLAEITRGDRE